MSYDWVTDEVFRTKLEEIVGRMSTDEILATPGVYEILVEELNNEILEELEEEREESEGDTEKEVEEEEHRRVDS